MPSKRIKWDNLTRGVSTQAPAKREPGTLSSASNAMMREQRGLEKRDGTRLILAGDTTGGELNVTNPTQDKFVQWIDRDDDEKFGMLIDPQNSTTARAEVFTLVTRSAEAPGDKMTLTDASAYLDYIGSSAVDVHLQFTATTIADSTILLNRNQTTALTGSAKTYIDGAAGNIRDTTNANNETGWSCLPQPPVTTTTVTNGVPATTNSAALYYTQDDDLGWPSGWYAATSSTQAPWYERIETEGANSRLDETKLPVKIDFDGTDFAVTLPGWEPRYSGDSFTNPGPSILTNPFGSAALAVKDLCFFQSRMWLAGEEFVDSSQTNDFFNLWQQSQALLVDSDPVRVQTQGDAVTTVDWLVPTDYGVLAMTRGNRQFFIASGEGAMTPQTATVLPAGSYRSVDYIRPVTLGSAVYFGSEQNLSNTVWEYTFDQQRQAAVAREITDTIEGYIPKNIKNIRVSEQNQMLFVTTTGEPTSLYVCQMAADGGNRTQTAWFKWTLNCTKILDVNVVQSDLYLLLERDSKVWLERINLDTPSNDDDAYDYLSADMGFAVRLDQKVSSVDITAAYDAGTGTTTWTIPHTNHPVDTVVLGQGFDQDWSGGAQRWRGRVLKDNLTIDRTDGTTTTVKVTGDYTTNLNGDAAGVWLGKEYEMRARLNEPFERREGEVQYGVMNLRTAMLRVTDTGSFRVEVTPFDRNVVTTTFSSIKVGQYTLGEALILADDEFHFNILGSASSTIVELVNDSPYPSRFDSLELTVTTNPYKRDPSRGVNRG